MQKSTVSSNTFNSKCLHSPFQVVPKAESPHQHCLIQGHEDTHRCSSTTQCWVDYPASGTCFPCKHLFLRCMYRPCIHRVGLNMLQWAAKDILLKGSFLDFQTSWAFWRSAVDGHGVDVAPELEWILEEVHPAGEETSKQHTVSRWALRIWKSVNFYIFIYVHIFSILECFRATWNQFPNALRTGLQQASPIPACAWPRALVSQQLQVLSEEEQCTARATSSYQTDCQKLETHIKSAHLNQGRATWVCLKIVYVPNEIAI